jgi:hypothetical protein
MLMSKNLIVYNPEDVKLHRIHEFATPVSSWGNEIITDLDIKYSNEELKDWLEDLTWKTKIVANITDLEDPDNQHLFRDIYPRSPIKKIIEKESPGGDIRKYTTDLYGGVDRSIKFDLKLSSYTLYTTGFEPISIHSLQKLVNKGICRSEKPKNQHYPTAGEILDWSSRVCGRYPSAECGAIGAFHFDDREVTVGLTGFVIYGADEQMKDWVEKEWIEEENINMKYAPSEFDFRKSDEEYSAPTKIELGCGGTKTYLNSLI